MSARRWSRREFLMTATGGSAAVLAGCRSSTGPSPLARATLHVTPSPPGTTTAPGLLDRNALGLPAQIYVPAGYMPDTPVPLVVLLHGAGRSSDEWMQAPLIPVYDAQSAVMLAVDSYYVTWDLVEGGFGPDPRRIDAGLAAAFLRCNIDPSRLVLAGFSDGASYALSLGLANGNLFSALMAFSPGFVEAPGYRGKPRIYEAHGTQDTVLPIDTTSRVIVPALRARGYDVTYNEFTGVHAIYTDVVAEALAWLVAGAAARQASSGGDQE